MTEPDWKRIRGYKDISCHACEGVIRIAFHMTEEGQDGENAYVEKRKPDLREHDWLPC